MNENNKVSKPRAKRQAPAHVRLYTGIVTARPREILSDHDYISDMGFDGESFSHNALYAAMWER